MLLLSFSDKRIKVVIGDSTNVTTVGKIREIVDSLDIVIDDASHISSDIIKNFANFFPLLNLGVCI